MYPSRALFHPLASMLALAALLLPLSSGESFAQDCATLEKPVMAARAAGDLPGVNAAVAAAKSSAGVCSGDDLRRIAHLGALAYYDKAIAQELTNEQRKDLLEQGLKISAPWKMSATLAQLEAESKNYARAAELYQNALDDIADAKLNPVSPGEKVIESIFRKAEEVALLSSSYVKRANHRGEPGGLIDGLRGFSAQKVAIPVQFVYREATFTPDGMKAAKDMADFLRQKAYSEITLIGHTDKRGSRAYNIELSQARAKALADFLMANGFTGKIKVAGKGFDAPYVSDGSLQLTQEEIWQRDRRVELIRPATPAASE